MFQKATRRQTPLKLALSGASGSGKTFSALALARGLVGENGKIALIDTENKSASLYAGLFDFDVCDVAPRVRKLKNGRETREFWAPDIVDAINSATNGGYDALIIDSASHIWEAALAYKARLDENGGNSFVNWNDAGNHWKTALNAILQTPLHVVACFRTKTEYAIERNDAGKATPVKLGTAPVARDGADYEFSVWWEIDRLHVARATKDRLGLFGEAAPIDESTGERLGAWLDALN